ncbi:MAG: cation-translocating P-type ATPase [Chloroflexi bacterium]|nr:cation-translocating P-type ATPase [Chloroflexota bacterium]
MRGGRAPCPHLLVEALRAHRGVARISFDDSELVIDYDPAQTSLPAVQALAERVGLALVERWSSCQWRLAGTHCADPVPGVPVLGDGRAAPDVQINCAAGTITAQVPSAGDGLVRLRQRLQQLGLTRPEDEADQAEARERVGLALLTALCALFLVAGRLAEALGAPHAPLYLAALAAGGVPSLRNALVALRRRTFGVDLLMLVAAAGAAALGEWFEGGVLLFLFSLSTTLEAFALGRTRSAIRALLALTPDVATVERDGREELLPAAALVPGDVVLVRPGERVPADGVVVSGTSLVDQAAITGESAPVPKDVGDECLSGTVNQQAALRLRVTRPASESTVARMVRMVEQARAQKARAQHLSEWFGQRYTLAVISLALAATAVPLALGHPAGPTIYRALTLLVVASPCAVVLATPAAVLSAIARAAQRGLLFKGGAFIERLAGVRVVLFDKTGTLTVGRPAVASFLAWQTSEAEALAEAAAAEQLSEHPLARAVVAYARERGLVLPSGDELEALPGHGVRARVGEAHVVIGNERLWATLDAELPAAALDAAAEWRGAGQTVAFVGRLDGARATLRAIVGWQDELRPTSRAAVAALRSAGLAHVAILTGDEPRTAAAVARALGMDYHAGLLPEDKVALVRALREQYGPVAMVGDGVNDAPALAAADVGIAMGGIGSDAAIESADLVLASDDMLRLVEAYELSRATVRIVRQSLAFGTAVIALLLVGALAGLVRLSVGVVGHEGSTLVVVANGLRLLRWRP